MWIVSRGKGLPIFQASPNCMAGPANRVFTAPLMLGK